MKTSFSYFTAIVLSIFIFTQSIQAQEEIEEKEGYEFTIVKEVPATPVKNQYRSGTCWSFSSLAFVESELLRMGKGEYDLSEMFIIRYNYIDRLRDNYLREGKGNSTKPAGGPALSVRTASSSAFS